MLISLFLVDRAAVADIPSRLNPGSRHQESASPTQPEMGSGPPPPRCWGGALGRRGSRARGNLTRRLPLSLKTCLPSPISAVGNQRRWRAGGRGPGTGQGVALGGLPRVGAGEGGVQLPFFRLPESRLASGGSTAALASSLPAAGWRLAATAGRSRLPRRPRGLEGWSARGAGALGPRRARAGSREGLAIRSEGWEARQAQGARAAEAERAGDGVPVGGERLHTEA